MFYSQQKTSIFILSLLSLSSLTAYSKVYEISPEGDYSENSEISTAKSNSKNKIGAKGTTEADPTDPKAADKQWAHRDAKEDKIIGTSTLKAYRDLKIESPKKPIIVAVIDSGIDINHEDLKPLIWKNEKEIPNNGIDDDRNGYVDDIHGWNFLGNKRGQNIDVTTLEVTREVVRLLQKMKSGKQLSQPEKVYFDRIKTEVIDGFNEAKTDLEFLQTVLTNLKKYKATLKSDGFREEFLIKNLSSYLPKSAQATTALDALIELYRMNPAYIDESRVIKGIQSDKNQLIQYNINTPDASKLIGDNPNKADDIGYGNNNVMGPDAHHGTHCAGIIGAVRGNNKGMDGQTNFVRIMSLRAVPNGDERDKDIGNAIFYAVNNGAKIISMSFGKAYSSPLYSHVEKAMSYAKEKGVLLVHAAGNSSQNNDRSSNFPNSRAENFIEVGASTPYIDQQKINEKNVSLVASFSNYGKRSVDLFSPGFSIYSAIPMNTPNEGSYAYFNGTSMAAPEVSGVAALLLSQVESLNAKNLKNIILSTVTKVNENVYLPGTKNTVPFNSLSVTGGIVNAYQALLKAGVSRK